MVEGILKQSERVKPHITEEDRLQLQADCIKKYYFYLIQIAAGSPMKEMKNLYKKMNELFLKYEPDYLKNKYIKLTTKGPFRRKLHLEIKIFALSEKLHFTPLLMKCVGNLFGDKI